MPKYIAEFIGTFALVFFGTGAMIVNEITDGVVSHVGVSLAFGAVVMIVIYMFGGLSGAHINPVVSLGFLFTKAFKRKDFLPYLVAQFAGGVLASFVLKYLFPTSLLLGMTQPADGMTQTFILEIIITFFLMFVILVIDQNPKMSHATAPAVGATVMLACLVAGPICNASMNPARSFGPALAAEDFNSLWIYFLAPVIGAILAALVWRITFNKDE